MRLKDLDRELLNIAFIGLWTPYLKCLGVSKAVYVLEEIHMGICSNYTRTWSIVKL